VPAIRANIEVAIVSADNVGESSVTVSGTNKGIISDTERLTFGLSDSELKDAIEKSIGKRPDDAFLKSPTPWGLYVTYGWHQVATTLIPHSDGILGLSSQPTIVMNQFFNNSMSSHSAEFTAKISQEVKNTIISSWKSGGAVNVGLNINYAVDLKVVSVSGSTSFNYTSSWGQSVEKSQTVTVGSESAVKIMLDAGQVAVAQLYATRGSMKIQVDYIAFLSGDAAVNYNEEYDGHHFWRADIQKVMNDKGIPNYSKSSEVINVGYYTNSTIVIKDLKTSRVLHSVPAKVIIH
jgi:hypothetical protein